MWDVAMGAVDSEFECTRHIMQQRLENNVYIVMLYFNMGFVAASSSSLLLVVYILWKPKQNFARTTIISFRYFSSSEYEQKHICWLLFACVSFNSVFLVAQCAFCNKCTIEISLIWITTLWTDLKCSFRPIFKRVETRESQMMSNWTTIRVQG